MITKVCLWCKKEKPLSEFGRDRTRKDKQAVYCKVCVKTRSKQYCQEHPEEVRAYSRQYYQKHLEKRRQYSKQYRQTPRGTYFSLKCRNKNKQPILFTINEFVGWYNQQETVCHYCGCPLKRGKRRNDQLTIDRKDNDLPYSLDNIVLSCMRCNMAKGSWFTETQMLEIGNKYLRKKVVV